MEPFDPIEQREINKLTSMLLLPEVKKILLDMIDSEIAKLATISSPPIVETVSESTVGPETQEENIESAPPSEGEAGKEEESGS